MCIRDRRNDIGQRDKLCFHVFLSVFTRFFRKGNKSERPMPHSAGYFRRAGPRTPFHLQRRPLPVIALFGKREHRRIKIRPEILQIREKSPFLYREHQFQ